MGCSGSKSTSTETKDKPEKKEEGESNNKENKEGESKPINEAVGDTVDPAPVPPERGESEPVRPVEFDTSATEEKGKKDEVFVSREEAEQHVQNELGISEERAKKLVAKVNKNDDDKISNDELIELWQKIKDAKNDLKPKFEKYDTNSSNFVEKSEAMEVLTKKFPGVKEESLKAMITRYDDNGDGKINFNEFIYFYAMIKGREKELKDKFQDMDKDESGTLNPDDVTKVLQEECVLEEKMARSLVEDYDMNKDGKIDKTEFNNLWIQLFESNDAAQEEEVVE